VFVSRNVFRDLVRMKWNGIEPEQASAVLQVSRGVFPEGTATLFGLLMGLRRAEIAAVDWVKFNPDLSWYEVHGKLVGCQVGDTRHLSYRGHPGPDCGRSDMGGAGPGEQGSGTRSWGFPSLVWKARPPFVRAGQGKGLKFRHGNHYGKLE
jgi:hypothetical protein